MIEKGSSFKIWDVVKIFLLFLATQLGFGLISALLSFFTDFNISNPIMNSILFIIGLIIVIMITKKKFYISFRDNLIMNIEHKKMIIWIMIFSLGLSIFISELGNYVQRLFPMSEYMMQLFNEAFGGEVSFIGAIIRVIIVAPITEEILFRGIMLKGLLKRYSAATSILVTSFLFALIHFNIYQFVGAFIAGILLGWLFTKTKSLTLCIIGHAAYNSIGYIIGYIFKLEIEGYTLDGFQPIWFTLFGVALLIIAGLLIRIRTNNIETT